jgi:amino acid transporter
MVGTLFLNTIAGLVFLIPLVFVMPDIAPLIASGQPVPLIFKSAVGSNGGAIGLLIPLMVLAILCGIGCTTATSRCAWAFARDGAIPGAKLWMKVNHSLDVPLNAMMLCMVVEILLGLIYFGSNAAFLAFSGVGVMCLTAAYAAPIAISLFTGRKQVRQGLFYLGPLGLFCNVVALGRSKSPIFLSFSEANPFSQLGLPWLCRSSVCPRTPSLPLRLPTMPPSYSLVPRSSLVSGTGSGDTATMPVLLPTRSREFVIFYHINLYPILERTYSSSESIHVVTNGLMAFWTPPIPS